MSLEQLKAFLTKVKGDSTLQEKLKAAKVPEDVVTIAKEHGHEFDSKHLSQLSKEERDSLAGGKFKWHEADVPFMGYPIDTL